MKFFATAGRAAVAAGATVLAGGVLTGAAAFDDGEPVISDSTRLMEDYDVENIVPLLQEMGLPWEGRTAPDNSKVIIASTPAGLKFSIMPTACSDGPSSGCHGVSMTAIFEGDVDQRTVNSFNYRYQFTNAGIEEGGAAYLQRYEIADYGVPRGNFVTSLSVFLVQAGMLKDSLETATVTVSRDSYLGDLAANALNMQALFADDARAGTAASLADTHQVSLEKSAEFVRVLLKAESQQPGKIVNFMAKPDDGPDDGPVDSEE